MRTATLFVLALVALVPCHLATSSACRAAPPEADPANDYHVTSEAGPCSREMCFEVAVSR